MNKHALNKGWKFVKEKWIPSDDLSTLKAIDLPHTWNNIDGQDGGNDYLRTISTYVKTFDFEPKLSRTLLEFEGVNSIATVVLNGVELGTHRGGYSTFRFDITNLLKKENNQLIVYVDNTHHEDVYPLAADFTFYGGIYRSVSLIETSEYAFDLLYKGGQGVYVSQERVTKEQALLTLDIYLNQSSDDQQTLLLTTKIKDREGHVVSSGQKFIESNQKHHQLHLEVNQPHLWQSIDDPYLYTVEVELYQGSTLLDHRSIPTGLRYFTFDHESFYLNGIKTRLNGVSRHQDRKDIGNALTDSMHEEDIQLIKEIGANSIRLAHYQHADYFYTLCDQEGFVIWAEIPYISMTSKTDHQGTNALEQLEELIIQNYNHSSIIMWGISNEITIGGKKNNLDNILVMLNERAKQLDPTRVTTMANVSMLPIDDVQVTLSDVMGYNHYFGWYGGQVEDFTTWLNHYRQVNPTRPLCLSEYGVEGIHTYHTETPKVKDYSEEYHALWHEKAYQILSDTPYIWGTYVWNMFAFAADFRDEGGSKGMNNKGLVTFDRTIKKDAFYYYKARWSKEDVLHICSKRFKERNQKDIEVKVYSNLEHVTLEVNGKNVKEVDVNGVIHRFQVSLNAGENHVKASANHLLDETTFILTDHKNPSYEMPEEEKDKGVFNLNVPKNWFDDITEQEKPLTINPAYLSVKDSIANVINHPHGKLLAETLLADLLNHPFFSMMENMSFEQLRELAKQSFPYGAYVKLNDELQKIKK